MAGAGSRTDLGPITIGVGCHPAWANLRAMEPPSRSRWKISMTAYAKLKERGVKFDMEKTETPVCWMAQFRDPDGNKLVIHKRKEK